MVTVDGQLYNEGEEPDLGSWQCTSHNGNCRDYMGLSKDVSKLPKDYIATGSTAMCIDTGDFYIYDATTKTWKLQ